MKRTEQDFLAWANEHLPPRLVAQYRQNLEWVKGLCRMHRWEDERVAVQARA